jgi:hypothetical protein
MKSRTPKWGRVILASIVLVAVPALLLAEAGRPWNRGSLPISIRGRVHFAAAQVPAFPMGDPRLDKPENWPERMTIGGVPCVRRIHAWDDDDAIALASLKDAEPEHRLMLFYDHAGSGWNSSNAGWGPRYSWNEHKKLIERIWYEPDSSRLVTHDYTYYRSGRLLGYSVRQEPRKHPRASAKPYEFLSEFFDNEGHLIAIGYEKMSPGSRDSVYAWMGDVVPYDQFRMKTHILYSSAHPGDR